MVARPLRDRHRRHPDKLQISALTYRGDCISGISTLSEILCDLQPGAAFPYLERGGPTFFRIYINDLPDAFEKKFHYFANDSTLCWTINHSWNAGHHRIPFIRPWQNKLLVNDLEHDSQCQQVKCSHNVPHKDRQSNFQTHFSGNPLEEIHPSIHRDRTLCWALVLPKQSPWLLGTILDRSPLRHRIPTSNLALICRPRQDDRQPTPPGINSTAKWDLNSGS